MPELLLEIFSEEIPARMQLRAAQDLQKLVQDELFAAGFMPEGAKAFATPRRLALVVTGLPAAQPDRKEERKGPRVGAPEKAIEGFLKSAGLESVDQCETRSDKKGEYYVVVIDEKGRPTADVIAGFMPELIRKFPWPKSMRWGDGDLRWVRPLHSILCVFDGEVVPFEVDGIASGDRTYGHRFLAPDEIQVRNFEDYELALSRAKVVLEGERRAEQILEEAKGLCAAQGLELIEDQGLLNEVAGLAEWPVTLMGSFDEKFLTLPDEVLTATMKGHQKYFSVRDPKTGRLANRFIFVSNIEAPDGGAAMRDGYERVLTARLSDAWFLYQQDLRTPLEEHAKKLSEVTYFEVLGSIGDKVERVAVLARNIAPLVSADHDRAETVARLAKADLVSSMVYEFPELQGLMGRYYALAQDIDEEIADAIRDHYKPAGQSDDVPAEPIAITTALADKLDTLCGFWALGEIPTGSKDPYAIRRSLLGIVKILLERNIRINLSVIFEKFGIILAAQKISQFTAYQITNLMDNTDGTPAVQCQVTPVSDLINSSYEDLSIDSIMGDQYSHAYKITSEISVLGYDVTYEGHALDVGSIGSEDSYHKHVDGLKVWRDSLLHFVHERLKGYLKNKNHHHDHVDAVRIRPDGSFEGDVVLEDDLVLIVRKLEALEAFLQTDDGENLLAAYKRAGNILKAEEKKEGKAFEPSVDEDLLKEPAEQDLHEAMVKAQGIFGPAIEKEEFGQAMTALANLRGPLDQFFEDVTVNAEDPALRMNRLALLTSIKQTCEQVADFSRVEG